MHVLATAPAVHLFLTFSVKSGLETYTTKSTAEIECSDCLKLKKLKSEESVSLIETTVSLQSITFG